MAESKGVAFPPLEAPKVRPYTAEEHERMAFDPGETQIPGRKRERRMMGFVIDAARYRQAIDRYPEMEAHLSHVLTASLAVVRPYVRDTDLNTPDSAESNIAWLVKNTADGIVDLRHPVVEAAAIAYPAPATITPIEAVA